jgi:HEAT repeat protein
LPILRECLVRNRSSEEVAIALEALGRFGSADDRDTARGKLGDDDALVRQHAAICLGHIGTPDDVEALRDLLDDRDWWVRYRAAGAIAELLRRQPTQLRAVIDALVDRDARNILERAAAESTLRA